MSECIFEIEGVLYNEETGEICAHPQYKGELVRCKNCEHWECDDSETYCDELGIYGTDINSYCSYAKKKEE